MTITLTYFMATTLTTVGLGDFHPRSNGERIAGSLIMLFGVSFTSLIMENLSKILKDIKESDKPFSQADDLS